MTGDGGWMMEDGRWKMEDGGRIVPVVLRYLGLLYHFCFHYFVHFFSFSLILYTQGYGTEGRKDGRNL
jgi:hypothetical protein